MIDSQPEESKVLNTFLIFWLRSNLDYPDFFLYFQFCDEYLLVMIKICSHILFLLLSEISSSIGSIGMVCKTNKLALRMFIHNHQVENESGDDEEDERILAKPHLNKTSHTCQHHAEITQSHTFAALIRLSTATHNLLTFNISEISSNNLEKLGLLANKYLWTFLSHSSYASFPDVESRAGGEQTTTDFHTEKSLGLGQR